MVLEKMEEEPMPFWIINDWCSQIRRLLSLQTFKA